MIPPINQYSVETADLGCEREICELNRLSIISGCYSCYTTEQISSWLDSLRPSNYVASLGSRSLKIVRDGGKVIGFGNILVQADEITALYVHPSYFAQGIGKSILVDLEQVASVAQISCLKLYASVNAQPFYLKMGYRTRSFGVRQLENGGSLPCILMEKQLGAR